MDEWETEAQKILREFAVGNLKVDVRSASWLPQMPSGKYTFVDEARAFEGTWQPDAARLIAWTQAHVAAATPADMRANLKAFAIEEFADRLTRSLPSCPADFARRMAEKEVTIYEKTWKENWGRLV